MFAKSGSLLMIVNYSELMHLPTYLMLVNIFYIVYYW